MEDTALAFFLDRLVHGLREPLRSVSAFSEVLKEQAASYSHPENERILEEILEGGQRMRTITDALSRYSLALEKPAEGECCALKLAADLAAMRLDSEIRESGARLDLGALSGDVPVRLERMTQVLEALFSNAIRFRGEAPPAIRVWVAEDSAGRLTISVEDNGPGIAPADREKIFLPFMRIHGRKYPGAGLGLTAARRIAENHGGSLRVAEGNGPGSIFEIILPAI